MVPLTTTSKVRGGKAKPVIWNTWELPRQPRLEGPIERKDKFFNNSKLEEIIQINGFSFAKVETFN